MKKNVGTIDKAVRILLAAAIAVLYFTHQINGAIAIAGLAVAGIFIVTSFISFCPIYFAFGLSTKEKQKVKESL